MSEANEKKEKVYTVRNVKSEMERVIKSRDKKKEKVQQLNAEIKADNAKLKELEGIYEKLNRDVIKKELYDAWFKDGALTTSQIKKLIDLSLKLGKNIDKLDVDELLEAISLIESEKKTVILEQKISIAENSEVNDEKE